MSRHPLPEREGYGVELVRPLDRLLRFGAAPARWEEVMEKMLLQSPVGPCDPPAMIEEWIDELLDLRLEHVTQAQIVAEIDYRLRQATQWLGAREAGLKCA